MSDKSIQVLIISEDIGHIKIVDGMLASDGFQAEIACTHDVSEALNYLEKQKVSIIIVDLKKDDEFAPLDELQKNHRHIPIIAVVQAQDEDNGVKAVSHGAQDYLVKGQFNNRDLTRNISHALERASLINNLHQATQLQVQELEEKISEHDRMDQLKDQFLSTVSHELKTPLTIIRGQIGNMVKGRLGELNEKQAKAANATMRNIERLSRLINELLDLSRLESGKAQVNRTYLDPVDLLKHITHNFQIAAQEKQLTVTSDIPSNLPALFADPDMIEQVITNLTSNALRYAKQNILIKGEITKFQINEDTEVDAVKMSVIDDGDGIPKDRIGELFNKFVQVNRPSGGSGYKGTGLGLAICKEIADLHQGKIWVESDTGKGAQFHLMIPQSDEDQLLKLGLQEALRKANENQQALTVLVTVIKNWQDFLDQSENNPAILSQVGQKIKNAELNNNEQVYIHSQKGLVVVIAEMNIPNVYIIGEKIERTSRNTLDQHSKNGANADIGMGIAFFPKDGETDEELLECAIKDPKTMDELALEVLGE